jgi:hypothetical protein
MMAVKPDMSRLGATPDVNSLAGCTRQQDMQFGEPNRDRVIPGRSADS